MLAPSLAFSTTTPVIAPITQEAQKTAPITAPASLETQVYELAQEYHQDPVLALKIIRCEGLKYGTLGNNKNLDASGNVWSTDIGYWQINDYYHERRAQSMGLNIHNEADNLRYGFILLSEEGTGPWSASKDCWSK